MTVGERFYVFARYRVRGRASVSFRCTTSEFDNREGVEDGTCQTLGATLASTVSTIPSRTIALRVTNCPDCLIENPVNLPCNKRVTGIPLI